MAAEASADDVPGLPDSDKATDLPISAEYVDSLSLPTSAGLPRSREIIQ